MKQEATYKMPKNSQYFFELGEKSGRQALLKELKEEVEKVRLENDDTTGQTHSILDLVLRLITSKMKE